MNAAVPVQLALLAIVGGLSAIGRDAVGADDHLVAAGASTAETATLRTPRTPDGTPDLNGTWDKGVEPHVQPRIKADGTLCVLCGFEANVGAALRRQPPERPKYKPAYQARVADLDRRQVHTDPALRCENPGLPRIGMPAKIVQTKSEVVFLYDDENGSFWRIVPTDGWPHRTDAEASALGDAIGRWEGETLVVETIGFTDDTWLTDDGSFHTADLKVTERFRREGNRLYYDVTAEDPSVLAEPWRRATRVAELTDRELLQPPPCVEQSLDHLVDGTHHDNAR